MEGFLMTAYLLVLLDVSNEILDAFNGSLDAQSKHLFGIAASPGWSIYEESKGKSAK
jgi:hypothetical protein